jgi:GrpB-like predicted nucleotidyltransferase (UPF0157 family)
MGERPTVVDYDARWPALFEQERDRLVALLAPWLQGGIHHVGSTSVPGLAAKPVIDMVAGVRELTAARDAFAPLAQLGYVHRPHRPEAYCFTKPGRDWRDATHALHLTEPGSDLWRERIAFRDALRADPALAAEYEAWKRENAAAGGEAPYRASKTPFVAAVLARRGVELKPHSERLSPREGAEAGA